MKKSTNTWLRGTWVGSEHRNTAKKINEHRITARKVNETPSPQHLLHSFTLKIILFHKINTLKRFFIAHMWILVMPVNQFSCSCEEP